MYETIETRTGNTPLPSTRKMGYLIFLLVPIMASAQSVSWSPAGNRLVYSLGSDIRVVDVHTLQVASIATGSRPYWHPIDDRILFSNSEGTFTIQADGSELQRIGDNKGRLVGWSPEGERWGWTRRVPEQETRILALYIEDEDLTGGDTKEIVFDEYTYGIGKWRPLGVEVFSVAGWAIQSSFRRRAALLDPDTGDWISGNRIGCSPLSIDWSFDGSWVVYSCELQDFADQTSWPILIVQEWGSGVLNEYSPVDTLGGVAWLSWAPDGKRFVFNNEDQEGNSELFIAEGGAFDSLRQITFDKQKNIDPNWSPNGSVIAYRRSSGSLEYINLDTLTINTNIQPVSWGILKRQHSHRR